TSKLINFHSTTFKLFLPNIFLSCLKQNDLFQPFHRVLSSASSKGRGVAGVLEADFIKPTHDKQDFEKSQLYQKLINRLKEMTNEYWYNC
ncbi:Os11g0454800, partial [Oryza sativa Japonica Group]